MHVKDIAVSGPPLGEAVKVLIMIHGRGANADDILSLAPYLSVTDFTLLAPRAVNHTWYPNSFLAPSATNEPWLSSALDMLKELAGDIKSKKIRTENIYLLGFSQGACLTLEFAARNADRYGGIIAFTGGLIGDAISKDRYHGNFDGTPVYIGTSDPDPHVPVQRVRDSVTVLREMGAFVTVDIYKNMGHTISEHEIAQANRLVLQS